MVLITVAVIYGMLGTYDGLGTKMSVPDHQYDMKKLVSFQGRLYYDDDQYTGITGIDVSEFQGEIDWEAVKNDGIDFVMIRLGYSGSETGKIMPDARFAENIKGARKAGLKVGVYFFSQAITPEEAIEEARYVISHIRGKGVRFPIAFDMEPIDGTERTANLTDEEKTAIADAFCQVIKRNGHQPVIYGNPRWFRLHIDRSYLSQYDTWLAHYVDKTGYRKNFVMWQYTDSGVVAGIDGYVDMNIFFKKK